MDFRREPHPLGRGVFRGRGLKIFLATPLLIVVLAGLGTAHILVRTAPYGVTVRGDSTIFLSTALNFLAGEGWQDLVGEPLHGAPPLFPLLLAAFGWVGIDPLEAGRWINATAFGLTILVAGYYLRSQLRSRWLTLAATATIAASLPLSHWASILLTDFPFAVLTLLALIQLAAFLTRRTTASLGWAAVFTALAAVTRWPGVALIGTGVLLLWLLARRKDSLVFGAVSSMPLLAVLAHNWASTGDLTQATGNRGKEYISGQSLSAGLNQTVDVFREWVVPPNAPDEAAYLLWLAIGGAVLVGAAISLRTLRIHRADPAVAAAYIRLRPALPFGVFALIYLGFMVAVVPLTVRQEIGSRYLLPVYVPLLLTAVLLLDRFLSIEVAGWRIAIRSGLAALVGLATLVHGGYSARENRRLTAQARDAGYTYKQRLKAFNTPYRQRSETLNSLRENPIAGRIYSNKACLLWFADRTAAPGKYKNLKVWWTEIETGAHIVWFDSPYDRGIYGYDYTDLQALFGVEPVAELADGFILRRTEAEPFDADRHRARRQRYADQLIQQADEQVIRAGWRVYRTGRTLIYRKQPCAPADVQAKFVLHVIPVDRADLPAHRKQYDFENLDFYFNQRGERVGDQCMVLVRLPTYAIDRIYIAQWVSAEDRTLWDAEFAPGR